MKKRLLVTLVCLVCGLLPATGFAADDPKLAELLKTGPDALLIEADQRLTNWKDQEMKVRLTAVGGSDNGRVVQMLMNTKGDSLRNMRFEEPADSRGMGVVIKGADEIYVRLPGSTNVRRVASHARKQTLQGTDVAFDDSSLIRLSPQFAAALGTQTEKYVELKLTRKAGASVSYPTLTVRIDKADLVVDHIEYFDDAGKKLKTEVRTELMHPSPGHRVHKIVTVTSHEREHATRIEVLTERINTGVSDDAFSKRWLMREL